MAYTAPTITAAGLSLPQYSDILSYFVAGFQSTYGQNVYLGQSSSDYQMLSIIALAASDAMQGLQLAYNQRSILTAVGSGLDALGANLNTPRKVASYSTVPLVIGGVAGTVINSGAARDMNGVLWLLPTPVTIPNSGSITVTGTADTLGSISAAPGTITTINTGTNGWLTVTNLLAASLGQPTETDSQYRARLVTSTSIPSQTILAGTQARIAAVEGVTRLNVFENPTGSTDANGTPAHSLTCVVEGGTDQAVATAIYQNKGIGPLTNGNIPSEGSSDSYTVTDPITGLQQAIGFYRPTYLPVYVSLTIHGLTGYTSQVITAITNALVAYLSSLEIGEEVPYGALWAVAMGQQANLSLPLYTVRALTSGTSASPTGTADITMAFYQVAQSAAANIVITVA